MNTDIRDPSCSQWASSSSPASTSMSMALSPPYVGQSQSHWRTSPMLSSTASDDCDDFELTLDCRRRPHSPVPFSSAISPCTPPRVAIFFPVDKNNNTTKRQDVRSVLNSPASFRPPSPAPRFNGFANSPLESPLSSASPDHHVAINNDNTRLRTIKLHHGLPQTLPPPPRPIAQRSTTSKSTPPQPSFSFLRASYLTMLAQKPTDTTPAAEPTTVAPSDMQSAWQDISRLTASPEFQTIGDSFPGDFESTTPLCGGDDADPDQWLNEPLFGDASPYMTSPHDVPFDDFDLGTNTSPMDSPFSSFIATPSLRDMDLDMESPLIHDTSPVIAGLGFNSDLDLFGATAAFPTFEIDPTETAKPKLPATDKLWTFSPSSPALDTIAPAATVFAKPKSSPASAVIPPSPAPTPAPTRAPARRRVTATGTRKNLRPEALIPLDAPTQKRTYATPSATSRKAVPDAIVKKRLHSAAFAHEHDDDDDEDRRERAALGELSPTASEAEVIEYKRRQNTLAARKSRKRKLEHQQRLEGEVQDLKGELTMWRERALMAQELLKSAGVPFSFDA